MKKNQVRKLAALLAVCAIGAPFLGAQVLITPENLSYTQNFNNGYSTNTASYDTLSWADNSTIPGWYLFRDSSGTPASVLAKATTAASSAGNIFLVADTSNQTNFILGTRISVTTSPNGDYFGLALTNNTGGTVTEFSLGYTALQWYRSTGANKNTISTSYQVIDSGSAVSLTAGSWDMISGLSFTAPQAGGTAATLNFNNGNFTNFAPVTVSGINWGNGDTLLIRWYVDIVGGVNQGMGIDNISFTATAPAITPVPEPAATAMLFGAAGLGAFVIRRRRARALS
jgi:hypothetical protein